MALKIRLSRGGAKKRPYYRVVVADSRKARDGRFIERIGSYNPMVPKDHPDRFKLDEDRAKHWMSVGATPSDRVAHLMNKLGLADKPVVHEQTKQHLPRPKTLERMKEREEKAAEEAAAEEAPAEEAAGVGDARVPALREDGGLPLGVHADRRGEVAVPAHVQPLVRPEHVAPARPAAGLRTARTE